VKICTIDADRQTDRLWSKPVSGVRIGTANTAPTARIFQKQDSPPCSFVMSVAHLADPQICSQPFPLPTCEMALNFARKKGAKPKADDLTRDRMVEIYTTMLAGTNARARNASARHELRTCP
jgi:hypothetical protein